MDEGTVRQYAQCMAIIAKIEAVKIQVIGMVAKNDERASRGEAHAYGEDAFNEAAAYTLELSKKLDTEI